MAVSIAFIARCKGIPLVGNNVRRACVVNGVGRIDGIIHRQTWRLTPQFRRQHLHHGVLQEQREGVLTKMWALSEFLYGLELSFRELYRI